MLYQLLHICIKKLNMASLKTATVTCMALRLKRKAIFLFMMKHIIGWLIPEFTKSIVKKCNVVLSFDSVTRIKILTCDYTLNESY